MWQLFSNEIVEAACWVLKETSVERRRCPPPPHLCGDAVWQACLF